MKRAGVCSDSSLHPAGRGVDPLLQHLELQPVARRTTTISPSMTHRSGRFALTASTSSGK